MGEAWLHGIAVWCAFYSILWLCIAFAGTAGTYLHAGSVKNAAVNTVMLLATLIGILLFLKARG